MLQSWRVGDAKVSSIVEYSAPTHDPTVLYPKFDRAAFEALIPSLPQGHYYPATDRLTIAIQIWLLEVDGKKIIVDTGVGNAKPRTPARMKNLNTLFLAWLEASGAKPDDITHVVLTHMHPDHVGWNTVYQDGAWVPTFANARYLFPKVDYDAFSDMRRKNDPAEDGCFADSVDPVVEAGLVDFIEEEGDLLGVLTARKAAGHTPGMMNYWLERGGETAVFTGDVFHHPIQVLRPDWNTAYCLLPEEALTTRARLLADASERDALIMTCHFAFPHAGKIRRRDGGYFYEPVAGQIGT